MPKNFTRLSQDYERIESAITFISNNYKRQPQLHEIAEHICLSEFHFQRLFSRWVGISPKRFLQYLTVNHAKEVIAKTTSLLDATYESGLSGPGRLHDLFISQEGMSPGEFKSKGLGLTIYYGIHKTQFGDCVIGITDKGICDLSFVVEGRREFQVNAMKGRWQNARYVLDEQKTAPFVDKIFDVDSSKKRQPLHIFIKGTNFQIKVWKALLEIPPGYFLTYNNVARKISQPKASRAVGTAVANNPISFIIPCHRVIRSDGNTGNYQGGPARKKALLAWEMINFSQR